ncbi:hypothetical protein ACEPPN_007522 [Leptodophora sp. 'Broadleaf-Isolate-01']
MPEQAGQKKEGLVDKIFHHDRHKEGEQATGQQQAAQGQREPHKESEEQKFKEYMAEEKKLDQEGEEYGGLM